MGSRTRLGCREAIQAGFARDAIGVLIHRVARHDIDRDRADLDRQRPFEQSADVDPQRVIDLERPGPVGVLADQLAQRRLRAERAGKRRQAQR